LQQRYSYLRPGPRMTLGNHVLATDDIFDFARRRNITVLAFSAMLGGVFTRSDRTLRGEYAGPDSNARMAMLRTIAAETGATPTQIVLTWMLHSNPTVLPLISASSPEVMHDNLGALHMNLTPDQMERLNSAGA
jgi:aryl-alcohol dehydrogenase-like predicted oxidoreductase